MNVLRKEHSVCDVLWGGVGSCGLWGVRLAGRGE